MPDDELLRVLRTLTDTASRFEKAAAKHRRIESERSALQEAITGAQLFLSVQRQRPLTGAGVKEAVSRAKAPSRRGRGGAGEMRLQDTRETSSSYQARDQKTTPAALNNQQAFGSSKLGLAGGWNVRSLQPRTNPLSPGSSGKKKARRKPRTE